MFFWLKRAPQSAESSPSQTKSRPFHVTQELYIIMTIEKEGEIECVRIHVIQHDGISNMYTTYVKFVYYHHDHHHSFVLHFFPIIHMGPP